MKKQTGDQKLDYVGAGVATEIALEITRYQEIRVVRQTSEVNRRSEAVSKARFLLGGSIRKSGNNLKGIVSLTDLANGIHIWGDAYRSDMAPV